MLKFGENRVFYRKGHFLLFYGCEEGRVQDGGALFTHFFVTWPLHLFVSVCSAEDGLYPHT